MKTIQQQYTLNTYHNALNTRTHTALWDKKKKKYSKQKKKNKPADNETKQPISYERMNEWMNECGRKKSK